MKKALVVGCSYTYGQELVVDSKDQTNKFEIEQEKRNVEYRLATRWVSQLCTNTNAGTILDLSRPGASNDYIFRIATDYLFLEERPDVAIIGWTYDDRVEFYDRKDQYFHQFQNNSEYSGKDNLKFIKQVYYDYNFEANVHIQKSYRLKLSLATVLRSMNIPFLFCESATSTWGLSRQRGYEEDEKTRKMGVETTRYLAASYYNTTTFNLSSHGLPRGPGNHPLAAAHSKWADVLTSHVKEHKLW